MNNTKIISLLVAWFGIFQVTHLIVHFVGLSEITPEVHSLFLYSALQHTIKNDLAFALTILDIIYALLSLVFVFAYFTEKKWSHWLGSVCLFLSLNSMLLFDYIAIASGSWKDHSFEYAYINIGFIPVLVLTGIFTYRGINNLTFRE